MRKITVLLCLLSFSSLFACQQAKEEVTAPAVSQTSPAQPDAYAVTDQNRS